DEVIIGPVSFRQVRRQEDVIDQRIWTLDIRKCAALFIAGTQRNHAAGNQLAEVITCEGSIEVAAHNPVAIGAVFVDHFADGGSENGGSHTPAFPSFALCLEVQRHEIKVKILTAVIREPEEGRVTVEHLSFDGLEIKVVEILAVYLEPLVYLGRPLLLPAGDSLLVPHHRGRLLIARRIWL